MAQRHQGRARGFATGHQPQQKLVRNNDPGLRLVTGIPQVKLFWSFLDQKLIPSWRTANDGKQPKPPADCPRGPMILEGKRVEVDHAVNDLVNLGYKPSSFEFWAFPENDKGRTRLSYRAELIFVPDDQVTLFLSWDRLEEIRDSFFGPRGWFWDVQGFRNPGNGTKEWPLNHAFSLGGNRLPKADENGASLADLQIVENHWELVGQVERSKEQQRM